MSNVIPIRHQPGSQKWLLIIGIGIAALVGIGFLAISEKQELQQVDATSPHAISRSMPICNRGRRIDCVVDGDTIWLDGEKIRLDSMNAPEVQGQCDRERDLATRATQRLSELLSASAFSISRSGTDRYGRTLARLVIGDQDVGLILVREGLAHAWQGRKLGWC